MKRPKKLPVWYTPKEAVRLVANVPPPARRNRLIMLLGLLQALRVSEITKLRIERVDLVEKQMLIYQSKFGKDRLLPISKKLIDPLRQWIGDRKEGWMFPSARCKDKPITTRAVQIMVKEAGRRSGLLKRAHAHGLRHSALTRIYQQTHDIMVVRDFAGHANIQTSQVYIHGDVSAMREALNQI